MTGLTTTIARKSGYDINLVGLCSAAVILFWTIIALIAPMMLTLPPLLLVFPKILHANCSKEEKVQCRVQSAYERAVSQQVPVKAHESMVNAKLPTFP